MCRSADNMGCGLAGKMGFLAGCAFAMVTLLIVASTAVATPTMTVTYNHSIGDFDDWRDPGDQHPGNELMVRYFVTNTSEQAGENNMIDFTLPAGLNQGVYDATTSNGWAFEIGADSTKFYHGLLPTIHPGEQAVFELYSISLYVSQKVATATAMGIENDMQFNPVQVDVPGDLHTLVGDISGDGIVDANDVGMMAENWLAEVAGNVADISAGGRVDFVDFAMLANDWGKQEPWYVP